MTNVIKIHIHMIAIIYSKTTYFTKTSLFNIMRSSCNDVNCEVDDMLQT